MTWLVMVTSAIVVVGGLLALLWPKPDPLDQQRLATLARYEKAKARPAEFVGSRLCASCHQAQHIAWHGTQHQRAMQHATVETVAGDFKDAKLRHGKVETTFFRRDDKFFVRTDGADGALGDFEIKYVFGVHPLQRYLIEFSDGRVQALPLAWDTRDKDEGGQRWFHLYPNERVDHRDDLHWTRREHNWNFMCADCHSTNVRKNYNAARNAFKSEFSEISVGCESCHGPGSLHIEWTRDHPLDETRGLMVKLDERAEVSWRIDPDTGNAKRSRPRTTGREIEVCAQCHARRAQFAEGYHAGKRFLDHYRPALLQPDLYYADGQQRDEVYVWGSFLQSRMHQAGVTCSDCHEPHTQKLRLEGDALCGQCHLADKYQTTAHHFHKPEVGAPRCVDCHMPARSYLAVDARRDHSLRVPRPDLSVALGVPNACNGCHANRSPQWADSALRKWLGRPAQGHQRFAQALSAGVRGSADAASQLVALARDTSQPAIARASALAALARHPSPDALAAIGPGLRDADPLLRIAAIAAVMPLPAEQRVSLVAPLLDDPLRAVRIDAAAALADAPDAAFNQVQQASLAKAAAEFEQTQRYNADRPEARTALGNYYARRKQGAKAEIELRAATQMRPLHESAFVSLANLYREQGRDGAGEALLAEGLKLAPDSAALHHARGLALARLQRIDEALDELKRAAALAPGEARFAYLYAVSLNSAGKLRAAMLEIDRALKRHPRDRDLLSAGAAFARDAGDRATEARFATRLQAIGSSP